MTFAAGLFISGRDWLVPVLIVVPVLILGLVVSYRRTPGDARIRLACFFLKLIGILALAACLLEPLWTGERARPGANLLAVVADNSQGLQIHDAGNPQSRGEMLHAALTGDSAGWLAGVEENFQLRRHTFDTHLHAVENFAELNFAGRATSLGAALRTLGERFKGRPLAGVLLFTDGNATDLGGALPDFAGLPPVYPVLVGRAGAARDLAVQNVAVSRSAFEDAPITVQADVSAAGFAGEQLVVQLLDAAGKKVEEQAQPAPRNGENAAFRFQVKPEKPGVSFYRLRAAARNELEQFDNPKISTEATLANNTRVIVADRGAGPYRVLYVAGRPNWEFKFLNRALADDDQVQLTALIRIAKREPKFEFRGRAGETSNPLFRGFGNQNKDEVEQYDKPVLIRLNTRDETELAGGFPKTPDELYGYNAVIVDDLEAEFFTAEQQLLLQKFVSERGGGFLMLGGMESFREGQYLRTPVGDMLPVYLDRAPEAKTPAGLRLDLTREGMLQPWARLNKTEAEERKRLDDMPPFLVLNPAREVKPGATAIATVKDADNRDYPALVAQRFGHGRTAALLIGDLWHWGFRDAEAHKDMDKAWRQSVRWLVSDVPNRVELAVEKISGDANQAVKLRVKVRDEKFLPLDNAAVSLLIRTATATNPLAALRLIAEPAPTESGVYEAVFVPREEGGFHVEAAVTNAVGASVGRAEAGLAAEFAAEEFRSLNPNKALLEQIAARTGGEVVPLEKVAAFAKGLPTRRAPITEPWTFPLWHTPAMFLFALACFVAEWGLRRAKGFA